MKLMCKSIQNTEFHEELIKNKIEWVREWKVVIFGGLLVLIAVDNEITTKALIFHIKNLKRRKSEIKQQTYKFSIFRLNEKKNE